MRGHSDWWSVVRAGEDVAHQLPRDAGSCLATQTFLKGQTGISMLQYYCSGLRQQPRGNSIPHLTTLAKTLWKLALQRDITLTAQHILGVSNIVADTESRTVRGRTDWKLSPEIFSQINQIFMPLEVDLFASKLTQQLPHYFSWRSDPLAEATDAFRQDWRLRTGYANPLWCLMGKVLSQVIEQKALIILVAPVWKGQPWYPVLLSLLWEFPRLIPSLPDLIQNSSGLKLLELMPQLAMWSTSISGKSSMTAAFQKRLQVCCWPPGGPSQASLMTHTSGIGLAGVLNEVPIPLQDL